MSKESFPRKAVLGESGSEQEGRVTESEQLGGMKGKKTKA